MIRKEKIGVITLGCSKNTVDSERLISQLKINNFDLVTDPNEADSIIINTCGFIDAAKEESINTIIEAAELKKGGNLKKIIVAGCLSERYSIELKKEIPEVDKFYGTEDFGKIIKSLGGNLKQDLLGERDLLTPKHYAYLKISEGCDNPCSFCAIPLMRGKHKTKPFDELILEAKLLAEKGVKEINIIGQDTTDYGKEYHGRRIVADLLNKLSEIDGIEWIRLLYAYPSHFPDDLIDTIANNPEICNYIDIPLQHISDKVLKSMRRGITKKRTIELLKKLKERIPDLTLRTTFIVGYPAESDREFDELCLYLEEEQFDRMGVFEYSMEENTPSYLLGDPIPQSIKQERKEILMNIQKEISLRKNEKLVNSEQIVLIDSIENDNFIGRTEKDAPEVDGEVLIKRENNTIKIGNFCRVKICDCNEYDLFGKLI
ncbi:30S ribosomal protein S12 methylthiotransferase RimO [Bacteroidota bacterium]